VAVAILLISYSSDCGYLRMPIQNDRNRAEKTNCRYMYVDVEGYVCKWGVPTRRHSSRLSTSVAASAGNAQATTRKTSTTTTRVPQQQALPWPLDPLSRTPF